MDVSFESKKLKAICEDYRIASRKWGPDNARAIVQRLTDILAFDDLEALIASKRGRCHPLLGDRKGQFAMDLKHGLRLIFIPDNAGWEHLAQVTKVIIKEVSDYHV